MTGLSVGKALGYATMPRLLPRISALFFSGFGNIAYFIALTYALVRLLPQNHHFLNPEKIGHYGVRHVVAAALHELKFEWRNIDQIIVFFALLAGCVVLLMYILATVAFLLVSPVSASMFSTPNPSTDVAYIMLDRVFGIPGIYNSEVTTNLAKYGPFPNTFQVGLQTMFQFFSMGLFLLSLFVFLYYILVVVAETTFTGTPFGHRFDNIWIPLRVIAALGLLMPWSTVGLNTAQFIVLYAAKYGSALATNTWILYNSQAGDTPIGLTNREIIARPAIPDYSQLIKDLFLIRGCMQINYSGARTGTIADHVAEFRIRGNVSEPILAANAADLPMVASRYSAFPGPVYNNYAGEFQDTLTFYDGKDIKITFGTYGTQYAKFPGNIFPTCGTLVIPVTSQTPEALYVAEGHMAAVFRVLYGSRRTTAGAATINADEEAMILAVERDYLRNSTMYRQLQKLYAQLTGSNPECFFDSDNNKIEEYPWGSTSYPQLGECEEPVPPQYWLAMIRRYQEAFSWAPLAGYDYLTGAIAAEDMNFSLGDVSYITLGDPNPMAMEVGYLKYGWGGAGLWYNKISQRNGSLMSAVGATPFVEKYPFVMEQIKEQRLKGDSKVETTGCELYNPNKSGISAVNFPLQNSQLMEESGVALYRLCVATRDNEVVKSANTRSTLNSNPILNIINSLFGASNLFNILDNRETHPMAMLATLGRTLIDKAVMNLAAATGVAVVGGLNQLANDKGSPGFAHMTMAAANVSKALVSFGSVAFVAGFILFYVMPFLPFIYFFFAVGRWVKTIFEAMVGVPLWALAHLKMSGPGLPGTAASSGYFLILEIAIRPVLTVISLVAAFSTFAASVIVLNYIFNVVVTNIFGTDTKLLTGGADPSVQLMMGIVDQLFMTMIYVLLVYMIGMSSFKLIDLIPDNIMRWSGAGVRTWGGSDNADDLVDNINKYTAIPAFDFYKKIGSGITGSADVFAADAARDIRMAEMAAKQQKQGGGQPGDAGGQGGGGHAPGGTGGGSGGNQPSGVPAPVPQSTRPPVAPGPGTTSGGTPPLTTGTKDSTGAGTGRPQPQQQPPVDPRDPISSRPRGQGAPMTPETPPKGGPGKK